MKIQGIVSDVRQQIVVAGRNYQGAFKAYVEAQRKALAVVTSGGASLANTEIGAAKNIFSSARARFEQARSDGLRQLASEPKNYVPKGRAQLISAYKSTIDQLVKTSTELNEVVSTGYRNVIGQLTGVTEKQVEDKPADKTAQQSAEATTAGHKTASRRSSSVAKPAAAKKTSASQSTKSKTASGQTTATNASKSTTTKTTKSKAASNKSTTKKTSAASTDTASKSATTGKSAESVKTSTEGNSTTG